MIIKANHYLKKLLLSIIIPTHNSEHTIKGCVLSLTSQSYPREKFEIIVVDDGSTDKTITLAKNAGADKIIEIQPCFQGKARNIGVENSKTEYLAFIDSDCEAKDGWIKTIIENLPHVKAITGPIEDGNPQSLVAWSEYLIEFGQFHKFRRKSQIRWMPGCNIAFTKDVFLKTGGFTEIPSSEDLIFGESLMHAGFNAFFIPSPGMIRIEKEDHPDHHKVRKSTQIEQDLCQEMKNYDKQKSHPSCPNVPKKYPYRQVIE